VPFPGPGDDVPEPLSICAGSVRLREFTGQDVDDVAAVVGDDRVTRWVSFANRDRASTERMIVAAIAAASAEPRTEYFLAVTDLDTDRALGIARLVLGDFDTAKLGYAIHADHWSRGYATDAARALVAFGFLTLGLHRITAAVGPKNLASQAVVKRLGFALEGRLRDHVFVNGAWRDSLLYSLLVDDWSGQLPG
jgi:[ribosomal protein S5]-alanine N-acetyltransferase